MICNICIEQNAEWFGSGLIKKAQNVVKGVGHVVGKVVHTELKLGGKAVGLAKNVIGHEVKLAGKAIGFGKKVAGAELNGLRKVAGLTKEGFHTGVKFANKVWNKLPTPVKVCSPFFV